MKPFAVAAVLIALTVGLVLLLDAQFPGVLGRDDNQIDLVWKLVVLAALIGSLAVGLRRERLGSIARSAVAWLAIGLALVAGYSFKDELMPAFQRVAGNVVPALPIQRAPGVVALRAGSDGHFHALAEVAVGSKAERVRFMVDTGASDVALSRDDARRLGIDIDALRFSVPYSTANGTSFGAPVRLDRLRIGDVVTDNLPAHVMSGRIDQSLLGMSFLRRLSAFELRGEELVLRQ